MSNDVVTQKLIELPTDDVKQFNALYPQRGAFTWFVRDALKRFLALHDAKTDTLIELAVRETTVI